MHGTRAAVLRKGDPRVTQSSGNASPVVILRGSRGRCCNARGPPAHLPAPGAGLYAARLCARELRPAGTVGKPSLTQRLPIPRRTGRSTHSAAARPGHGCWPRFTSWTSWPFRSADSEWRSSLSYALRAFDERNGRSARLRRAASLRIPPRFGESSPASSATSGTSSPCVGLYAAAGVIAQTALSPDHDVDRNGSSAGKESRPSGARGKPHTA